VTVFYDRDGEEFNGVMIADGLSPDIDGLVHYTWDTSDVAAGE